MAFLDATGLERLWLHIVSRLNNKVDKVVGKDLSTNDYTTEEKQQLATLKELVGETAVTTQINNAISNVTPDSLGTVSKEDYYGLVEEEGAIISANSLYGAGIKATSYIAAIQSGANDPSPDNIRPINGWDTVKVTRTNKNLFNVSNYIVSPVYVTQTKFVSTGNRGVILEIKPNTTYTVSKTTTTIMRLGTSIEYPADQVAVSSYAEHSSASAAPLTITSGPNDKYMVIQLFANSDTSGSYGTLTANISSLQVEIGETATKYERYNGLTLTAEMSETVYGGALDWTTGLLTITHFAQIFDGTESWVQGTLSGEAVPVFYIDGLLTEAYADNQGAYHLCSHYKPTVYRAGDVQIDKSCYTVNRNRLLFKDSTYSTVDEFKTYLANQAAAGTPITIMHPLKEANYYVVQLTPQQLEALQGMNIVQSNCGNTRALFNYSLCGGSTNIFSNPIEARENLLITVSATQPTSPTAGMIWLDISE